MCFVMERNMQTDMMTTEWFRDKVRSSKSYAQNLYAAMCENDFQYQDTWTVISDQRWGCSWRAAARMVANLRDSGEDYLDYYCSGMGGFAFENNDPEQYYAETGYVRETTVTDEIREDLKKLGWVLVPCK